MPKPINFTTQDYEVLDRKVVYDGFFNMAQFHIRHKLFDGSWSKPFFREIMERPPAAAVMPYDPDLDKVVLIEQFRVGALAHPTSPWLIEIIAGIFDKDETAESVVLREALEEAGCKLSQLHPICDYFVSPGGCNEHIALFIGRVDATNVAGIYGLAEESENIRAFTCTLSEALAMVNAGKIKASPAIISILWLHINKERLLTLWQVK